MAKLVSNVYVPEHGWFGPGDEPSIEVAELITNSKAWEKAPAKTPAKRGRPAKKAEEESTE
jgi:hypothetical protein